MKHLLLLLALTGCVSQTRTYGPDGHLRFSTTANCASLRLGADGSLTMTGVDHATGQRELANTITARANGFAGLVTALGTAVLVK